MLIKRFASILNWVFRRARQEQQLDDELQAFQHPLPRKGATPELEDAMRQARIDLGIEQVKERVRTERHGSFLPGRARSGTAFDVGAHTWLHVRDLGDARPRTARTRSSV